MTEQEQFDVYFEKRLAEPPLSLWKFWKMGTRKTNTVEPQCSGASADLPPTNYGSLGAWDFSEEQFIA